MEKLTKEVKNEIRKYINHAKKMQECRENIEKYFMKNGIDMKFSHNTDDEDFVGGTITDCIIDAGLDHNFKNTVEEIEKIIKWSGKNE